jgi:hypothetical protein
VLGHPLPVSLLPLQLHERGGGCLALGLGGRDGGRDGLALGLLGCTLGLPALLGALRSGLPLVSLAEALRSGLLLAGLVILLPRGLPLGGLVACTVGCAPRGRVS